METDTILILFGLGVLLVQGVGWAMQIDRVSAVVRLLEALVKEDEAARPAPEAGPRAAPPSVAAVADTPPMPGRGRDLLRARLRARQG
jgi:hypothetical protein